MRISKYNSEGYFDPTTYEALKNVDRAQREARQQELKKSTPGFRPLVYICSPYAGDTVAHTNDARRFCRFAVDQKCIPVAPHLLFPQFMDDASSRDRSLALFMGNVLMSKCQEVWVFGDTVSSGMAQEIDQAERHNMKIRYFSSLCTEV